MVVIKCVKSTLNIVDFYIPGASFGNNLEDHSGATDWNFLPSLSSVSVSRYLSDGFVLTVAGTLNKIDKFGDASADDLSYYGLDGTVKYSFAELINSTKFDPYLGVGGGYTWVDEIGAGTVNGTLGFNYWFTDNVGLTVQSSYKHAFEDYLKPLAQR